jgi:hypothetical protein
MELADWQAAFFLLIIILSVTWSRYSFFGGTDVGDKEGKRWTSP